MHRLGHRGTDDWKQNEVIYKQHGVVRYPVIVLPSLLWLFAGSPAYLQVWRGSLCGARTVMAFSLRRRQLLTVSKCCIHDLMSRHDVVAMAPPAGFRVTQPCRSHVEISKPGQRI